MPQYHPSSKEFPTIKIPAFIRRLAKLCAGGDSRYSIGGIKCESDGKTARATATDGRILATVHWRDDERQKVDMIADAKQLASLPAKAFMHPKGVSFDGTTMRATIGPEKTAVKVASLSGRYPDCEKVMHICDDADGYVAVKLDAELLSRLCDLSHEMDRDSQSRGITLFVKDAQSCVFACAESTDGHVARMAIMPRASDDKSDKHTFPARPNGSGATVTPKTQSEDYIDLESIVIPA